MEAKRRAWNSTLPAATKPLKRSTKPIRARGKRWARLQAQGIRLDAAPIAELRHQVFERSCGYCENPKCQKWTPEEIGEMDHIKERSKDGADSLDNCRWFCRKCHRARHGELAWSVKR